MLSYIQKSPLNSNRDVSICQRWRFILHKFTFEMKYDIINKIGVVLKEIQIMSYFELYQENPSLLLIILLISFVVTIFVYGAFPLIFAKTTKKPITKKKYKRLCYGLNIIGMVCFIVLNGAASGGPYLLWTWIFSNCGLKTLNSRGLLKDNEQTNGLNNSELDNNSCENVEESTEKFQQNSDLDIDKMSPQEAAEYLVAEQLREKYTPKEKQGKKTKIKYCSHCGSQIDPVTKKCTGCGKQFFRGFKFTKFSVTVIALALVIVTISTLYVLQYINTQELKGEISTKQSTVIRLENEIDDLEKELNNYKGYRVDYIIATNHLEFYEKYAVLVNENSNKYHKYGCDDFDESYFWIFNIDYAKQQGYYACSKCH